MPRAKIPPEARKIFDEEAPGAVSPGPAARKRIIKRLCETYTQAQVGAWFGISRQRVNAIANDKPSGPHPEARAR